jgi:acyl carrier protein phosphodiesterase
LGNFLADMLHPRDYAALPSEVWDGVVLHREIDRYTDQHPLVARSKERIRPHVGKYAPVIIDVWYDLAAVRQWEEIARIPFDAFQDYIYDILLKMKGKCPESLRERLDDMVKHRWLETYRTEEGINEVFRRMGKRASNPRVLASSSVWLPAHGVALGDDFRRFFPDLVRHVLTVHPLDNPWLLSF